MTAKQLKKREILRTITPVYLYDEKKENNVVMLPFAVLLYSVVLVFPFQIA